MELELENNHNILTEQYKISDVLINNSFETFNILIENPQFLQSYIFNVKFYLLDESGFESELLNLHLFKVIIGSPIYENILISDSDIFMNNNIPFSHAQLQNKIFIIYNISAELIKQIKFHTIKFIYTLSNEIYQDTFDISWNIGIHHEEEDDNDDYNGGYKVKNFLRFMGGFCGCSKTCEHYYIDHDYYKKNKEIVVYDENYKTTKYYGICINHLDLYNNWLENSQIQCDIYSYQILLVILFNPDYKDKFDKYYNFCSDTIKISANFNDQMIVRLSYGQIDGITNIFILCDNTKYLINEINIIGEMKIKSTHDNIYEIVQHSQQLEFDLTNSGYKILGLSNFIILNTLKYQKISIQILFDNSCQIISNDIFIKFTRIVMDTELRSNIARSNLEFDDDPTLNMIDYWPL